MQAFLLTASKCMHNDKACNNAVCRGVEEFLVFSPSLNRSCPNEDFSMSCSFRAMFRILHLISVQLERFKRISIHLHAAYLSCSSMPEGVMVASRMRAICRMNFSRGFRPSPPGPCKLSEAPVPCAMATSVSGNSKKAITPAGHVM